MWFVNPVSVMLLAVVVFMIVLMRLSESLGAPERHHHHARHINRRQQRRNCTDGLQDLFESVRHTETGRTPGFPKNLVFRKETRPDRYPTDRQPAHQHRRKRDRHVLP